MVTVGPKDIVASTDDYETLSRWTSISDSFRATSRAIDQAVSRSFGMDSSETDLVLALSQVPDQRLKMSSLARDMGFSSGGVTKVAGRLITRGLVVREADEADRRIVYLVLSDEGRTVGAALCRLIADVVRSRWSEVLGEHDAELFASAVAAARGSATATPADPQ
jgi:DNA-binding MarR family transcriptional regulator